jgi:outer membrane protein assembly factor BamB
MPADSCFTHALTQPAIADVDGDATVEVLVSTTENALVAYDGATGTEEWRVPLTTYGYGRPTVATLSSGPGSEVVTSDIDGGTVAVHGNGSVAWRFSTNETVWGRGAVWQAPRVTDVDADGSPEVLLGTSEGPVVLSSRGSVEWLRNGSAPYTTVLQADDDPQLEIVTAGSSAVQAYDGTTGAREWRRELGGLRIQAAADGDGDGRPEIFAGEPGGTMYAFDGSDGSTAWKTTIESSERATTPEPVLGDVTGDGRPEVIAVAQDGTVAVLDVVSGAELAAYQRDVPILTFSTVADIDDDSSDEILVRYGDGRVVALAYE